MLMRLVKWAELGSVLQERRVSPPTQLKEEQAVALPALLDADVVITCSFIKPALQSC